MAPRQSSRPELRRAAAIGSDWFNGCCVVRHWLSQVHRQAQNRERARAACRHLGRVRRHRAREGGAVLCGRVGAVLLADTVSANDALVFLGGANLGAAARRGRCARLAPLRRLHARVRGRRRAHGGSDRRARGAHPRASYLRSAPRSTSRPTSRETTIATYAIPASCSIITSARANGLTGTTSLRPVLESVVKLRNSSSIQLR